MLVLCSILLRTFFKIMGLKMENLHSNLCVNISNFVGEISPALKNSTPI